MNFLTSIALIFLGGGLLGGVFRKLKMPPLVGMLIAGIILGPFGGDFLDETILSISADLREIALIIILLRAGLNLSLKDLKQIGRPAILISFLPACFEMLATIIIAPLLFDISFLDSAILAAVIASASPAVIVPRMLNLIQNGYGTDKKIPQLILAGDSIDDIFNIVVFTTLVKLASGENVSSFSFIQLPFSLISGIIGGIIIGYIMVELFKKISMEH